MEDSGKASSMSPAPSSHSNAAKGKPVVVRVKRKSSQSRVDAFWLDINPRPLKSPWLDLRNLSISDDAVKVQEESKTKKLLVQHVETISNSEAIKDVLQPLLPDSVGSVDLKRKIEERRSILKQDKKQDQLRSAAKRDHEELVRSARFEQIWKRRKGKKETDDFALRELCHLYDVVQIDDDDEKSGNMQEPEDESFEDNAILCNYLPLMRECLPSADLEDIEADMRAYFKKDNYVYDLYTVEDCVNPDREDASFDYPLVQVNDEDDDYYGECLESEPDSNDSNAEDNPINDYPDEESNEDDESGDEDPLNDIEGSDSQYEDEEVVSDGEDGVDPKWGYR